MSTCDIYVDITNNNEMSRQGAAGQASIPTEFDVDLSAESDNRIIGFNNRNVNTYKVSLLSLVIPNSALKHSSLSIDKYDQTSNFSGTTHKSYESFSHDHTKGGVLEIVITNGGSGYTSAPTVTVIATGHSGTTAKAVAVLTGTTVTSVIIVEQGTEYKESHDVRVSFSGSPTSAAEAHVRLHKITPKELPYLYVNIGSQTPVNYFNTNQKRIGNPMQFKMLMDYTSGKYDPYIIFKPSDASLILPINPMEKLHFSIHYPNGDLLEYEELNAGTEAVVLSDEDNYVSISHDFYFLKEINATFLFQPYFNDNDSRCLKY